MPKYDSFSKNGRHILQDLLFSRVRLHRSNFNPSAQYDQKFPVKIEGDNSSPELRLCCSICSESINLRPLALQEMEILAKFVLSQEQISLILRTEDHPPIFCCKICSSVILSLAELSTQIENITISLRAVISSRNGLFHKLKNSESKIEIAAKSECHKVSNHDDQQLTKCLEEEEKFSIKPHPTYDHDNDGLFDNLRIGCKLSETDGGCHADTDDDQQLTGFIEVEEEFCVKVEPVVDDKTDDITPDAPNEPETSTTSDSDDDDSDELDTTTDKERCKPCKINFNHKRKWLREHFKLVHDKIVVDIDRKLFCLRCKKGYTSINGFNKHYKTCRGKRDPANTYKKIVIISHVHKLSEAFKVQIVNLLQQGIQIQE
ncbi:uncharacterized protein LOC110854583 [Folsomia candida]|uniref:Uncharacterized protein n=1 Tax=Folsomia candida TaxID=158441 RepID=A0A226DXZ6_FOLCA|nr:uncharacterized protein LOC110854583 [Folsomia candida]OXA49908.1 hypothetical protein Fcan01_15562 [Folsomia candida]